ncbi:hypothetical protein [Oligoflexus tunisiensis]|uniref:hypothetical protein n=1 Tax=Oligoflexus tunisiensis TaxID=708132 RepID=UPI00114D187F|nr:hypothetical protein [Oligoflexus tunisiensis]
MKTGKHSRLQRILLGWLLGLTSITAYAIDCQTDCRERAREEWTCGVKCKKWKCKPRKCSAINPLRLATCETERASACAKDGIDRAGDWIDDRLGSDNGLGPKVAATTERFFKWSPALMNPTAVDCRSSELAVTWSWDAGDSPSNGNWDVKDPNTSYDADREKREQQEKADFLKSIGCLIDYTIDNHRSMGLMVCEDKNLARDIKEERYGAYYLQKSPAHVCKMKYRHLKNGPANLYDRSRNIASCTTRFETQEMFYGREMTFECHDMQKEMNQALEQARIETEGDYQTYQAQFNEMFTDLFGFIDLTPFPDMKQIADSTGEALLALKSTEAESQKLADEQAELLAKKAQLEALQKQIEADRAMLEGSLELHHKMRMEFLQRFKTLSEQMADKINVMHASLSSHIELGKRLQAWMNGVVALTASEDDISTDIETLRLERERLKSGAFHSLCEVPTLNSALKDAQNFYVAMESEVDSYVFQVNRLEIPARFIDKKSILEKANSEIQDSLARFSFVLGDSYLRLADKPLVCRSFLEASLTLAFYERVYENYGTLTALASLDAKIQEKIAQSQRTVKAIYAEDGIMQKINVLSANFWKSVNARELRKAVGIGNSADLYYASLATEIQGNDLLAANTKQKLMKLLDEARTRLKADLAKELTPNKFRSRLLTRLDQVAFDIMENAPDYAAREEYVIHLKPMLVGMLRFDEDMGFDVPLVKTWDEFFALEDKVITIESAWNAFKAGVRQ